MGGKIKIKKTKNICGEEVGSITAEYSKLKGIKIPSSSSAFLIDEYPILSVAAASANGTTEMLGIAELRVKETDRIKVMADGLISCGVKVDFDEDSLRVTNSTVNGGATISAEHDHRIAMSFLTLGMNAKVPITVRGCATIETSFPGFAAAMNDLGASLSNGSST